MFVAWRDLRFAKGRFALMGAVIVLITLLVGLLSGLTAGLGRQNVSGITGLAADLIVFGGAEPSYADSTVTDDQLRQWAAAPGVTRAEPLGIAMTKATAGDTNAAVAIFGVRPGFAHVDDRSVVLSTKAATDLDVWPGDTIRLAGQSLTVAEVAGDDYFSHTPVVWTSLQTWQKLSPGAAATVIAVSGNGVDVAAVDAAAGTTTVSKDESLDAIGSYRSENGSLQLMRGFLFAISALVIGAFFTVWTIQRSGDIAVLKALGAATAYLLRDALGQALVLLIGGTAIGTAAAVGLGTLVGGSVPFLLTPATVLTPAAVMVLLGALGAALSIRRIAAVDPLTALGSAR
ncbi:ABC transporter permease [Actinokineospora enzanensis]|uniref:ABC transporter permease n=1 Tax=Actinokineospora enzanensis TaxID=155975 RepID=UPI000382DCB2|nr:ABC transporter permease [Actinokineospora enzanensis]